MKKYFKCFSVAIIAVMLICSSLIFAGCGGDPKFDDYFYIWNDTSNNGTYNAAVSSAPYLAPTDPDLHTELCYITCRKAVKIKHITGTVTVTYEDAKKFGTTERVFDFDSYYDGDYMHLAKNYAADETIYIVGSRHPYRISNLKIEFEPIND